MNIPAIIVVGSSGRIGSDMARMLEERDIKVLRCDPRDPDADLPSPILWGERDAPPPQDSVVWFLACGSDGWRMDRKQAERDVSAGKRAFDALGANGVLIYADTPWRLQRPLTHYGWSKQEVLQYAHTLHTLQWSGPRFISDPIGCYFRDEAMIAQFPHLAFAAVTPEELFARWMKLTEYALGDWAEISRRGA